MNFKLLAIAGILELMLSGNVFAEKAAEPISKVKSGNAEARKQMIESFEKGDFSKYYDEKTDSIENIADKSTDGRKSVFFKTSADKNRTEFITKFYLPEKLDMSEVAANGIVNIDIYPYNPSHMGNSKIGNVLAFTLGSRDNEGFAGWYIGSDLLEANKWNSVKLKLIDGKPSLNGSTVNGKAFKSSRFSRAGTFNKKPDWSAINYYKISIPVNGKSVEGFIDNIYAASFASTPASTSKLLEKDPEPLKITADQYDFKKDLRVEGRGIIPPDVRKDAFFNDCIIDFSKIKDWKAEFYNCKGYICLSDDQAIREKANLKVKITPEKDKEAKVVLIPPQPIKVPSKFDIIDCWLYGSTSFSWGNVTFNFRTPDGNVKSITAGAARDFVFCNWTLWHKRIDLFPAGTEIVSICIYADKIDKIIKHTPGKFVVCHLDQLRLSLFDDYIKKPAPKFENAGKKVVIPVKQTAACPSSSEKVENSLTKNDGKYILMYKSPTESISYIYTPKTGMLSDISIDTGENGVFYPAMDSRPVFDFNGKTADPLYDCKNELVKCKAVNGKISATWKYSNAEGTQTIDYEFSLQGKSLVVKMSSKEKNLAFWNFGHASKVKNPKVIQFLGEYFLGILYSNGVFTSYMFDWYKSNVSTFPYRGTDKIEKDEAYYMFKNESKYAYLPKTNGEKNPLKETFYITASKNFHDVLFNISNPPTPLGNVLKGRLWQMLAGYRPTRIEDWRKKVELYEKYGITNLFMVHHAAIWSSWGGRGPEPFTLRQKASYSIKGGDASIIELFKYMKKIGMYPGYYSGYNFYQPICNCWNYEWLSLSQDGSWRPTWVQAYKIKPWAFAELAATYTARRAEKFGAKVLYEDGWTAHLPFDDNDYDHRFPEAGKMIDTIAAVAAAYRNERQSIGGPVFSEGNPRNFFMFGLNDGSYGQLVGCKIYMPDFNLLKIHPLCGNIGAFTSWGEVTSASNNSKNLYKLIARTIAYGNLGFCLPYGANLPNPNKYFGVVLSSYFLQQQLQSLYLMEPIREIKYWNGKEFVDTNKALISDTVLRSQVCVEYENGLKIYVNGGMINENWKVSEKDGEYTLPPGGWLAVKENELLEFSALIDGKRVNYVDSPAYLFLDTLGRKINVKGIESDGRFMIKYKSGPLAGKTLYYPEK